MMRKVAEVTCVIGMLMASLHFAASVRRNKKNGRFAADQGHHGSKLESESDDCRTDLKKKDFLFHLEPVAYDRLGTCDQGEMLTSCECKEVEATLSHILGSGRYLTQTPTCQEDKPVGCHLGIWARGPRLHFKNCSYDSMRRRRTESRIDPAHVQVCKRTYYKQTDDFFQAGEGGFVPYSLTKGQAYPIAEGQRGTCSGQARLGSSLVGKWTEWTDVDDQFECTTAFFKEDPIPGANKECQCQARFSGSTGDSAVISGEAFFKDGGVGSTCEGTPEHLTNGQCMIAAVTAVLRRNGEVSKIQGFIGGEVLSKIPGNTGGEVLDMPPIGCFVNFDESEMETAWVRIAYNAGPRAGPANNTNWRPVCGSGEWRPKQNGDSSEVAVLPAKPAEVRMPVILPLSSHEQNGDPSSSFAQLNQTKAGDALSWATCCQKAQCNTCGSRRRHPTTARTYCPWFADLACCQIGEPLACQLR